MQEIPLFFRPIQFRRSYFDFHNPQSAALKEAVRLLLLLKTVQKYHNFAVYGLDMRNSESQTRVNKTVKGGASMDGQPWMDRMSTLYLYL